MLSGEKELWWVVRNRVVGSEKEVLWVMKMMVGVVRRRFGRW